jgi:hypothetical protein
MTILSYLIKYDEDLHTKDQYHSENEPDRTMGDHELQCEDSVDYHSTEEYEAKHFNNMTDDQVLIMQ